MIVALDANALMRDPLCNGIAWRLLALGATSWGVSIRVPRVVVIEAVTGYERRVEHSVEALDKWADKFAGQLGLRKVHEVARAECQAAAERYAQQLDEVLGRLGVAVLEPPEVPLLALVDRAARRQRPCDEKGDGFRDTLNWLTIIDLARRHPDEEIVWITEDADFLGDAGGLHEDLVAELSDAGVADRVRLVPTLHELVTALAAGHPDRPLDDVRQRLRDQTLREYVGNQVLPQALNLPAEPRQCALPVGTVGARIAAIAPPAATDLTVEVRGDVDGSAVVSFEAVTEVTIMFETPVLVGSEPSSAMLKMLKISGLVTLDSFDRPSAGEITEVSALADDPGADGWRALDRANSTDLVYRLFKPDLMPGMMSAADRYRSQMSDVQRALAGVSRPALSPDLLKAIYAQQAALSPDLLKGVSRPALSPDLVELAGSSWIGALTALMIALWGNRNLPAATNEHGGGEPEDASGEA